MPTRSPKAPPSTTADFKARLREAGLRATAPRVAVLRVLETRSAPMSHAEVFEALAEDDWDRATIWRNLTDLAEASILRRTDVDHVWRFELLDADHKDATHPHFVCTACGIVECVDDIEVSVQRRAKVPRAVRRREVEVQLRGVCDDCA